MKRLLLAVTTALFLSACATSTPPPIGLAKTVQVPELPLELSKKATRLPDIKDLTFGGIIKDGIETDQQYNSVAHQLNTLIDLYICIRTSMNQEIDPQTTCLTKK
jgi:starvation-inducible outer membrane lipoprotein